MVASIFNDFFDNEWMEKANATAPAINVSESEREYKVEVAAPGMTKEDFNIHIDEDNNLVISMERKPTIRRRRRTANICAANSLTQNLSRQ